MHRSLVHESTFWDAAIALLLIGGLTAGLMAQAWILTHPSAPLLLNVSIGVIGALGIIGSFLVFWGSFIEPHRITLNTKSVQIKELPDLRIAVVGDFHVGPYKGWAYLRRVVEEVNALKPDIILLPGDFIFNHRASTKGLEPLKDLRSTLGTFAVLGNHDTGHMLDRKNGRFIPYRMPDRTSDVDLVLTRLGIKLLRNEQTVIGKGSKRFALAGSDHCWMDSCDLEATFKGIPKNMPVVLLSHIPDVILDKRSARASLIVSGHTHGGQIRLPFIGNLYPIPDRLGNAYDQGLFKLHNGSVLAITHGIGETMARARLFCPPEILVLNIRRSSHK
jgi:uncharacterized protein